VHAPATVHPCTTGIARHRQIQYEWNPVRTLSHLIQRQLALIETTIEAGTHGQKVLDCHAFLASIAVRDRRIGKHREHGLPDPSKFSFTDSNACQR
jgi:hypothetical protein